MTNFSFNAWNKILGWLVFVIALTTYTLTLEPTASFWDSGEYIATSANLEIGHPPGAPFYQMMGAFFSTFAPDSSQVALLMNFMSAAASAFTILFMFWSLVLLLLKLNAPRDQLTNSNKIAIFGSAFVGSLAFTFTDSFWFSAVEAEVYAMAACFMAILFYVGLLWERDMFEPRGNRWLILISLIIGLSFGVHFMALLAIPAIGFLYYFKNYEKITVANFVIANIAVVAVLMFIFKFLLPYTLAYFGHAEVFFTNSFGLPFHSGTIIALLSIIIAFYLGFRYTKRKSYYQLNTLFLCILFIFIGFSSWMMLPIRANANTVINENNPDDARELLAYYNREQYGETQLFFGPQFTEMYSGLDPDNPYTDDKPNYERDEENGKYIIVNNYKNAKQNLDDKHKGFLPRMWSTQHATNYMRFTGPLDFRIKPEFQNEDQLLTAVTEFRRSYSQGRMDYDDYHSFLSQFSQYLEVEKPAFVANMGYMFEFQFGYMYWRYLMWNYVGRQNDIQGQYSDLNGNWLSGIKFIDEWRLGSQENLPSDALNNKGRNTYYFLPFILGIIGIFFLYSRDKKSLWVLTVFFLFTGIALKIYLNERPFEPRERDYALIGSFYVFAIWIGFGVYAIFDFLREKIKPSIAAPVVIAATFLAAPVLLAAQNWDDHDRSNKYTALAMAKMYLDSVDENAILFTIGDNDTFALWYAQQIEGYRRDVRVVNTSLFATDWYIDQMKRKAWTSDPIPSQLEHHQFRAGTNEYVIHQAVTQDTMNIKNWMNWIASDNPGTKGELQSGQIVNTFPTKSIRVPVNKENAIKYGIVKPGDAGEMVNDIVINLNGNVIYKNRLLMLDIIANNDWKRPIYFTGGSFGDDDYLWMKDYLQLDGVAYKLVPIRTPVNPRNPFDMGRIDSDKMYGIVKGWDWGNIEDPNIYHDPETRKNTITYRSNLSRLIEKMLNEEDTARAKEMLDLGMEKMPVEFFGYYTLLEPFISGYFEVGEPERAKEIWEKTAKKYQENLRFYSGWDADRQYDNADNIITDMERYRALVDLLFMYGEQEYGREKADEFNSYLSLYPRFYESEEDAIDIPVPTNNAVERELRTPKQLDSLDSIYMQ
ncbi:DUF2723 domain-containing protein [soil metagenome]